MPCLVRTNFSLFILKVVQLKSNWNKTPFNWIESNLKNTKYLLFVRGVLGEIVVSGSTSNSGWSVDGEYTGPSVNIIY